MLNIHDYRPKYNTSKDDIINDFYTKCFPNCIEYKRGVGYFTSGWIERNSISFAQVIQNGAKIKYITSPILDENDIKALKGEYRKDFIDSLVLNCFSDLEENLLKNTREMLGWMINDGIIEFKFAVPKKDLVGGEFHDKFGIFIDEERNIISFSGSMNDSIKANSNYESITVHPSWIDERSKIICEDENERFDNLWEDNDPNLNIYDIGILIKEKLLKLKEYSDRPYDIDNYKKIRSKRIKEENIDMDLPTLPKEFKPRPYQSKAIESWISNNGKGLLSMATGSGKTKTALSIIPKLFNKTSRIKQLCVLIVVPYQHLLEQWAEESEEFNIFPIRCNSNYKWKQKLRQEINNFGITRNFLPIIVTNATYITPQFQDLVKKINNLFLIVDEAHNFGAKNMITNYMDNAKFRLGLSATPKRHMDEEGTDQLLEYFNGIVFEFTLKEAIDNDFLTKYYYHPVFVNLTAEEETEFNSLSKEISKLSVYQDDNNRAGLDNLLRKRALLISAAQNKIPELINLITKESLQNSKHNIFYCSSKIDEDGRHVEKVSRELEMLGLQTTKFTSTEDKEQRMNILKSFAKEYIDGLVAIRCLDEGVDIPTTQNAFILASNSNPKEFIQRRGRVLRKSSGKKFAHIYDFIVVPNSMGQKGTDIYKYQRKYLEREFKRYIEFAELANNCGEALTEIESYQRRYDLMHL
ncbi:DEAD/DEAH box helicase family protein [Arcobacter peruensis]|uniref:DEAD/DEAH box helicase family protein n=1 Tax=Arcobacter peruensis TaxID=2320140 RepID=UPI000F07F968|nr:DEAD/DEAH box helicase family protein [Arcobacter peruensis]